MPRKRTGNSSSGKDPSLYEAIIEYIFFDRYEEDVESFEFNRGEIEQEAKVLNLESPKKLGDVIYKLR